MRLACVNLSLAKTWIRSFKAVLSDGEQRMNCDRRHDPCQLSALMQGEHAKCDTVLCPNDPASDYNPSLDGSP